MTSGTVAAFLTILGYSMYDTIIVFDRIRENVPRMPRAAFSQIVNRSMSEVLTRSLITGLSTVFLIAVLLIFGGDDPAGLRLRDDGRRRLRYLLVDLHRLAGADRTGRSASPPTAPAAARIDEAMGHVPAFPEDNVVAQVDEVERAGRRPRRGRRRGDARPRAEPAPAAARAPSRSRRLDARRRRPTAPRRPAERRAAGDAPTPTPSGPRRRAGAPAQAAPAATRRRKHGRNRR